MKKLIRTFEDLLVYQKAYKLALEIHKITLLFPKIEQYALASQMRRASKSVCANIAEGFGKQRLTKNEFRRFLVVSLGSCDEMKVWISFSFDLGYRNKKDAMQYRERYIEVAKMLNGLIKNWN